MNCKNCGAVIKDGAKFCAGCGQTIKEPTHPVQFYSQPVQQNQYQPQQQNQQMYGGGYLQNQQNYGYQGQTAGYGGYAQQGGFGGYSAPPTANGTHSGIKTLLLLFMAAAMILSSLGLLFFPFAKSADEFHILATNSDMLCSFMNGLEANDGDFGETLEGFFEEDEEVVYNICFFGSVILLAVSMLFYIIGFVCIPVGNHSAASAIMGIGSIITAVGYLILFIEGISYSTISEDKGTIFEYSVSLAPLIMLLISAVMFILACVSAGKMRKA